MLLARKFNDRVLPEFAIFRQGVVSRTTRIVESKVPALCVSVISAFQKKSLYDPECVAVADRSIAGKTAGGKRRVLGLMFFLRRPLILRRVLV